MTTQLIPLNKLGEFGITYSRNYLARLIKEGKFPKPVYLTPRRRAFVRDEIEAYLRSGVASRIQPNNSPTYKMTLAEADEEVLSAAFKLGVALIARKFVAPYAPLKSEFENGLTRIPAGDERVLTVLEELARWSLDYSKVGQIKYP